ncbi:hypothetical protein QT979_17350 [Microcoleus sp. w2-18bC1]|uniref:hypothetical protein n=1 Tax=unclassified Microcoleus TaxID=2642155 RepID=UPI002FD711B4
MPAGTPAIAYGQRDGRVCLRYKGKGRCIATNTTIRCIVSTNAPQQLTPKTALPATPLPPETALPTEIPPQPAVSAPEPVSIQSKEPSLMSKLQAPDKEATVRVAVDMSETLHRKL